jgi:Sigma-70, region 4
MPKLTDLTEDLDARLERKAKARATHAERIARAARARAARAEREREEAEKQREAENAERRKSSRKGASTLAALLDPEAEMQRIITEARTTRGGKPLTVQQAVVDRTLAYYPDGEIIPAETRGAAVIMRVGSTNNRDAATKYLRVNRQGGTTIHASLEEATTTSSEEARIAERALRRKNKTDKRVYTLLASEYLPPEHLRSHALRDEYEPGFAPTEAGLSDWRIQASRDPATMGLEARADAHRMLLTLPSRERKVLAMRFGIGDRPPMTLQQVGDHFGVSRERIRQIEDVAYKKLRGKQVKHAEPTHPGRTSKAKRRMTARDRKGGKPVGRPVITLTPEQIKLVIAARGANVRWLEIASALKLDERTLRRLRRETPELAGL